MKKINLLIILLLTTVMAYPQHRLMQVHSEGEVAYEINTTQVDSVTFRTAEIVPCIMENYITEGSVWKSTDVIVTVWEGADLIQAFYELTFYPSENKICIKTISEKSGLVVNNYITNYCIREDTIYDSKYKMMYWYWEEPYKDDVWYLFHLTENQIGIVDSKYLYSPHPAVYPPRGSHWFNRQTN